MMTVIRLLVVIFVCAKSASVVSAGAPTGMMAFQLEDQTLRGKVLGTPGGQVQLLAEDGRMHLFDPKDVSRHKVLAKRFRGMPAGALRTKLIGEFGKNYQVSATAHYLIVHPQGQSNVWANRFEDLYRSMRHYYRVRGFRLTEPKFPLVAIVFPSQTRFMDYARSDGFKNVSTNVLGYYSQQSNRIALFDETGGANTDSKNWAQNAGTLIHEAAHQTAFNVGLHTRYARTPKWVIEGLGTMFEAKGVWDSRRNPHIKDRINYGRLENYRRLCAPQSLKMLEMQISSDRLFSSPSEAYATAWAMTMFLTEQEPRKYASYLSSVAKRKSGEPYTSQQRMADFTSVFGKNLKMLDARMQRFIAKLPSI